MVIFYSSKKKRGQRYAFCYKNTTKHYYYSGHYLGDADNLMLFALPEIKGSANSETVAQYLWQPVNCLAVSWFLFFERVMNKMEIDILTERDDRR